MKKLFCLLITLILFAQTTAYSKTIEDGDKTKIDLDKGEGNKENKKERSIDFSYVDAFLYASQNKVEVELFDVGEASITILNSLGQVVASDIVLTNIPTVSTLELPAGNGMYYIIIDSTEVYAQGWFVL